MLKVLIVDDEPKVCQLITNIINWEECGFEIVQSLNDGTVAYKYLMEHEIDVLITDIRMPGFDGLELIAKMREKSPGLYIIIISGYSYFEYTQNAIRYGVDDYILKPVRENELMRALNKINMKFSLNTKNIAYEAFVKKKYEENREKMRRSFLSDILLKPEKFGGFYKREEINLDYNLRFQDTNYQMIMVKVLLKEAKDDQRTQNMLLQKSLAIIDQFVESEDRVVFAIVNNDIYGIVNLEEEAFEEVQRKIFKCKLEIMKLRDLFGALCIYCAVSDKVNEMESIMHCVSTVKETISNRFYDDRSVYLEYREKEIFNELVDNNFKKKFMSYIEIFDLVNIQELMKNIEEELLQDANKNGELVLNTYGEILTLFHYAVNNYNIDIEERYHELIDKVTFYCDITELFHDLTEYMISSLQEWVESRKQIEAKPIRKAKKFISENYMKAITLEDVSNEIGFNPTYFSTMFKKETNMNFTEYIKMVRINESKNLLLNTMMSVEDISYAVGYGDVKHFSKLFKKITGVTPTEFRKLYN